MAKDPYRYFRIEARELIEQLSKGVLALEQSGGDEERISLLLRWAHTLKGAARVVRQAQIADLLHGAEELLAPFRSSGGAVPRGAIDQLLAACDQVSKLLDQLPSTDADGEGRPGAAGPAAPAEDAPQRIVRADVLEVDVLLEGLGEIGAELAGMRRAIGTLDALRELALTAGSAQQGGRALAAQLDALERRMAGGAERIDRELRQTRDAAERLRLLPAGGVFTALSRLREAGARIHPRHRWQGWNADGSLKFDTPDGELAVRADATLLALGGGSWKKLGSDGRWMPWLAEKGVATAPLSPSNCGFDADWSEFFAGKFAGEPLKSVGLSFLGGDGRSFKRVGECVITQSGIEGSLIYACSSLLRDEIARAGSAACHLDLIPAWDEARVLAEVSHPRGSRSLSSHLQSRLNLKGARAGILRECLDKESFQNPARLAAAIKRLPLTLTAARPIDEAISTAGGVCFSALDERQMLTVLPGVFCAGEMLDWEAPTGGYLLTACFASGRAAGQGIADWLEQTV
ncbi:TIGR03862 family flavoprotein [Chromobacterium phragmitis]|uniref:TIGR03862 family flavoprotein n=1 Tax=Chromobacterium phragmitis TaxID=2202141 RepID=UPI0032654D99